MILLHELHEAAGPSGLAHAHCSEIPLAAEHETFSNLLFA